MRVKLKAFPVVYFNAICKRHNCAVEIRVEESKNFQTETVVGAQVMSMQCLKGGRPAVETCEDEWELVVSAVGPIEIVQN